MGNETSLDQTRTATVPSEDNIVKTTVITQQTFSSDLRRRSVFCSSLILIKCRALKR